MRVSFKSTPGNTLNQLRSNSCANLHQLKRISNFTRPSIQNLYAPLLNLDLTGQSLKCLPNLSKWISIVRIKLDCNYLTQLPGSIFQQLPDLRLLSAAGNRIVELPEEICGSKLEELNLRNNLLEKLPANFGKIPLQKLYLRKNPIAVLPKSFGDIKRLTLDLDWLDYINDSEDI